MSNTINNWFDELYKAMTAKCHSLSKFIIADCERIIEVIERERNIKLTFFQARYMWSCWSGSVDASWLSCDTDEKILKAFDCEFNEPEIDYE